MSASTMDRLLLRIGPHIQKNEVKSRNRTRIAQLGPKETLMLTILYILSGADYRSRNFFGVSVSGFYAIINEVMDAIVYEFQFKFPTSREELDRASIDFATLSDHDVMNGCVGCIDEFY